MNVLHLKGEKLLDLLAVAILVPVAAATSLFLNLDAALSVAWFLILPAVWLCYRERKNYKKILIASLVLGFLMGMAFDFAAEFNLAYASHYRISFLDYHIIGKTPIGDFLWAFAMPFSVIVFYEHFLDDEKIRKMSSHSFDAFLAGILLFSSTSLLILIRPTAEPIPYFYFILGVLSSLPLLGMFFARGLLVAKLLIAAAFFFIVNMVFELTGQILGQWSFPGKYVASISIHGRDLPLEEFLFWMVVNAMVMLFCYEMLFDDGK